MFAKVKSFVQRNANKLLAAPAVGAGMTVLSTVASHAEGTGYTPQAVPAAQSMDISVIGNVWQYAQSFLQDTIAIISNSPLLVVVTIALP